MCLHVSVIQENKKLIDYVIISVLDKITEIFCLRQCHDPPLLLKPEIIGLREFCQVCISKTLIVTQHLIYTIRFVKAVVNSALVHWQSCTWKKPHPYFHPCLNHKWVLVLTIYIFIYILSLYNFLSIGLNNDLYIAKGYPIGSCRQQMRLVPLGDQWFSYVSSVALASPSIQLTKV